MSDISSEFAGKYRKNSRPTQTTPVQDITVEGPCKSAGFVRASGQQRSKLVGVVTIFDLAHCIQREGETPAITLPGGSVYEPILHTTPMMMPCITLWKDWTRERFSD